LNPSESAPSLRLRFPEIARLLSPNADDIQCHVERI